MAFGFLRTYTTLENIFRKLIVSFLGYLWLSFCLSHWTKIDIKRGV